MMRKFPILRYKVIYIRVTQCQVSASGPKVLWSFLFDKTIVDNVMLGTCENTNIDLGFASVNIEIQDQHHNYVQCLNFCLYVKVGFDLRWIL